MRALPLYPDGPPKPAIVKTPAQPRNSSCNACELHEYQMSGFRCHAGIDVREERQIATITTISGQPYLLVLLSRLNDGESAARFETSKQYAYVRRVVTELWPGPFSIDYAVRCPISMPQADDFELSWVDRCAPYTAARLEALRPARVIACGNAGLRTILGDTVDSLAAQGGWGWLDQGRPVFYLSDPDRAAWHPGYRGEFDALLRRALTIAADALPPHPAAFQTRALLVDTVEDAIEAFQRLMEATTLVYDTETVGQLGNPDFRILCAAVQDADAADVYVWTQEAFADPDAAHVFDYLMRSEVGKCAQHGKFDMGVLAASRGVEVGGHLHDTQYVRRFLQPERLAGLDAQSVLIGQGGYKREQAASEVDELDRLKARDRALGTKRPKGYYGAYVKGGVKAETLHRYVARDVVATAGLRAQQDRALRASARKWFWDEFIEPANRAVTQVEQWGVHASMAEMKRAVIEYSRLIEENEPRLRGVNPNSHKQVLHYLFGPTSEGCLGLEPTEHKTDGGAPSTKDEALLELYRKYDNSIDFIPALMRGRGLIKLRSTYAEGFQPFLRKDRRFHYSVNLDGTECLAFGELVLTNRGYLKVEHVRAGDRVLSHMGVPRAVLGAIRQPPAPIYKVMLADGRSLRCTGNHEFLLADGRWVRADRLATGDACVVHGPPEEWKRVPGFDSYWVSSWGRVAGVFGDLSLQTKKPYEHLKVTFKVNKKTKDFTVHRLVLGTFRGIEGEVRHLNGFAWDNTLDNLASGTSKENKADSIAHGTMSHRKTSKQTKLTQEAVDVIRGTPRSIVNDRQMAERFGVSRELVKDVRLGKRWQPEPPREGKRAKFGTSAVVAVIVGAPEPTIGLQVEVDHSHVTGGIVTHNTGRPSARDPACYTLPNPGRIDDNSSPPPAYTSKEAAMIRGFFTAPGEDDPIWSTGFYRQFSKDDEIVLLSADYSQLELRIAAMLARDPVMRQIFLSGEDYHMATGKLVALRSGVSPEEWAHWEELAKTQKGVEGFKDRRKPWRSKAKPVNFGLAYGKSTKVLAKEMGVSEEEGEAIVEAVLGSFSDYQQWMVDNVARGRREGGVWTMWQGRQARFRPLPDLLIHENDREHRARRNKASRDANNAPIQGTASDYCVASMTRLVEWIRREQVPARLTLSVYDSLLFEVPSRYVDVVARKAKAIMETEWETHGVPLVAEFELGRQLSNMKDYPIHAA